jgi:hypothetical protein
LRQAPADGGFGAGPSETVRRSEICGPGNNGNVRYRGDGAFNTPSLIEAADTGPFFHNNIVDTIEDAVAFYNSDAFANSPSGAFGGRFELSSTEIQQIAALLRVLNALDNMAFSNRLDGIAQRQASVRTDLALLAVEMAISETEDAREVLSGAELGRLYPRAIELLGQALDRERQAFRTEDTGLLGEAMRLKNAARDVILN